MHYQDSAVKWIKLKEGNTDWYYLESGNPEAAFMSLKYLIKELDRYKIGTWSDIIYRNALLYPDREAFVCEDERITFFDYNSRVNRLIHALYNMGFKKGDVIGILSWNCLEYFDVYGATMKGGFIASPFNPRLKEKELEYIINYSEANTLFVGQELIETVNSLRNRLPAVKNYISFDGVTPKMMFYDDLLRDYPDMEPDVQIDEDDPICIIYTSGTTGIPRGALYTHRCFMNDSKTIIIDTGMSGEHRHILMAPLFHVGGSSQYRSYLYVAGCNIILKSFDAAQTLRVIQNERATHIECVPTQLISILNLPDIDKYDLSSLKSIGYGGSPMPFDVLRKGMEFFGPIFSQVYGQSESGPAISYLSQADHNVLDKSRNEQKKLMSAGLPNIGVHVKITNNEGVEVESGEPGEILVKSGHIMIEYWKRPEDTKDSITDGWLHTGDIGYYDDEGYIYIVDRKKDMIVSGGENVFPREVEEVLYTHPAVLEAAVIGMPDPYWVEKVHAIIAVKQGTDTTAEELIAFCKEQLAGYKVPKSIEFVDSLPKNPAGKILKKELKKKYKDNIA